VSAAPRFECLNPRCPNYARSGVQLMAQDLVVDEKRYYRCPACMSFVRAAPVVKPSDSAAPLVIGAGGAALGGAMFGPPGALVGGLFGLLMASSSDKGKR
jgi:hypothetical protein